MFGNSTTQSRQSQVNVNTHLFTSYSDTCMLKVGAWNQDISIKFHPYKGTSSTGFRQYAQDNTEIIITSIKHDNALMLYQALTDVIDPAIKENREASVSIEAGAGETKKSITVATKDGHVSVSVSVGIDENGETIEANTLTHVFPTRTYFLGRDIVKGGGTPVVVQTDYLEFKEILKHIFDFNTGNNHGLKLAKRVAEVYSSQRPSSYSGGGGYSSQSSGYQAPTTSFTGENMSDFLPES